MLKISHLSRKIFCQPTKVPPKTTVIRYKNDKVCGIDEFVGFQFKRPNAFETFWDLLENLFK